MTIRAYLITTSLTRKIIVCGLEENDLIMRLRLQSEYKKADAIFISSNAKNVVNRYFFYTNCKESVTPQIYQNLTQLSSAIKNTNWPLLCLVHLRELGQLLEILCDLGRMAPIDINQFDPHFDDEENYFERFPHVLSTGPERSTYADVLNHLTAIHVTPFDASLSENLLITAVEAVEEENEETNRANSSTENLVTATQVQELALVPYVAPAPIEEEIEPATSSCVIM